MFCLIVAALSPNYTHWRVCSVYCTRVFHIVACFLARQHRTKASVFKLFDLAQRDFDIGTVLGSPHASLCPIAFRSTQTQRMVMLMIL